MSHIHPNNHSDKAQRTASHGFLRAMCHFLQTFISGPRKLLTSRISGKCAALMVFLCSPSLLFCAILTIPALLFQSPQQNAYFYFSQVLDQDPTRWAVLLLTGICAMISLAIPAAMQGPNAEDAY